MDLGEHMLSKSKTLGLHSSEACSVLEGSGPRIYPFDHQKDLLKLKYNTQLLSVPVVP